MVQVDYRLMHGSDLLVQVYSSISHSDSVTVVPSFYFYFRVAGRGKKLLRNDEFRGFLLRNENCMRTRHRQHGPANGANVEIFSNSFCMH
jgi:hypothetical protein